MIKNKKKNQKTTKNAKIEKKTIFTKNDFSMKEANSSFLLLILIDILKEYLKKITKILKTPYYYVRGA